MNQKFRNKTSLIQKSGTGKYVLSCIAFLAGLSGLALAEEPAVSGATSNGLTFEYQRTTFGVVEQGGSADIQFPFKNTSDKTITITEVRTTCGCTAAELEKKVFLPGEGDVIKAKFSSGNREGAQTKTIRIDTDETTEPGSYDYNLTFTGEVIKLVELESKVINLGDITANESKTVSVKLYSYKDTPVEIIGVSSNLEGLTFEYTQGAPSDLKLEGRPTQKVFESVITINVPENLPIGAITGSFKVNTNDTSSPVLDAVLRGRVVGDLTAVPDNLFFGIVPPHETTKRVINLTSRNKGESFSLKDVIIDLSSDPGATAEAPEITATVLQEQLAGRPNTQALEVSFTAPETQGRYTGKISFTGLLGEKDYSLDVPFNVYIRESQAGDAGSRNSIPTALTPSERQAKIDEMARKIREAQAAKKVEAETAEANPSTP